MSPHLHGPGGIAFIAVAVGLAGVAPVRADTLDFTLTLDGSQETPAVETAATGFGTATLDTDTLMFSWDVTFAGLSAAQTGAHFHGPAALCESAAVAIVLPLGSPVIGSALVTADEAADIVAGLWYLNIHTTIHPAGEIRGQIMPPPLGDPIPGAIAPGAVHVRLETVATGLAAPNWGRSVMGDASRLFVTDQSGILYAIDLDGGEKHVFLDVRPLLVELGIFGPDTFDERGLLGVAFHPDYATNGLLYTYTSEPVFKPSDFSTLPAGVLPDHRSVIREWRVPDPADPESVVDPTTSRALVRIDQPQFNHNAGALNFGPDGMLYVALGDGGGADDRDGQAFIGGTLVGHGCAGNGQDLETILGTIIRIDPSGSDSGNGRYGIPVDNPFVGDDGALDEIFAYGFRNPFRFSFDSATGDMYVADVGQNHIEEINLVVSGGNYGWNHKEGTFFFVSNGNDSGYAVDQPLEGPSPVIDPIAEYDHDEGIAIIGGFVYRGTKIPSLTGRYVFGEFAVTFSNDGRLFYLDDELDIVEFELVDQDALELSVLGMAQDANGEVYVLANATGVPFGETGVVLKIVTMTGDLDADGNVGNSDLITLLADWGPCPGCPADIDGDGVVGFTDLQFVLANWG